MGAADTRLGDAKSRLHSTAGKTKRRCGFLGCANFARVSTASRVSSSDSWGVRIKRPPGYVTADEQSTAQENDAVSCWF
jgi:hypothetical protein